MSRRRKTKPSDDATENPGKKLLVSESDGKSSFVYPDRLLNAHRNIKSTWRIGYITH